MMSVLMNTIVFEDCRNQWSVSRPLLGLILLNEKVSVLSGRGHRRREGLLDTEDHGIESWGLDNPEVLSSKASGLQLTEATEVHALHCMWNAEPYLEITHLPCHSTGILSINSPFAFSSSLSLYLGTQTRPHEMTAAALRECT